MMSKVIENFKTFWKMMIGLKKKTLQSSKEIQFFIIFQSFDNITIFNNLDIFMNIH